jgi:transglutaminase-like putative cysteine protease
MRRLLLILSLCALFAADRREDTYTITSVMQFVKPFNIADMTDDYQDARLIAQDEHTLTAEITYYPLNKVRESIGENPNWKRDYAGMTQYLAPTPTENWDEKMRADLVASLAADGIEPDKLTDRQAVTEVSRWLKRRSRFVDAFAIWYVYYPNGKPEVHPLLRAAFDKEKKAAGKSTDQEMFDQEVLGRSMFYGRVHGSCTSYAVYLATVMRALGIPTRIVFCVPPADANDPTQKQMLIDGIHHNQIRLTVRNGLPLHGFSNHLFNECYIGNRWVRVNYDVVGQNTLDDKYFGLLTHIFTTDSLSHVPMAETWGKRYAMYRSLGPEEKLSSENPYRLLKVSDHFGANAKIANPDVPIEELQTVTIKEAYWKDVLPKYVGMKGADPTKADFYIGIQEYIPGFSGQMRQFEARAGHNFVMSSPGHPEVKVRLSGMKLSNGAQYQMWGMRIEDASRKDVVTGAEYTIQPQNTSDVYRWTVRPGVVIKAGPVE